MKRKPETHGYSVSNRTSNKENVAFGKCGQEKASTGYQERQGRQAGSGNHVHQSESENPQAKDAVISIGLKDSLSTTHPMKGRDSTDAAK